MQIAWMSVAMEEITRTRREELIGMDLGALSSPHEPDTPGGEGWATTVTERLQRGEKEFRGIFQTDSSGTRRCYDFSGRLVETAPGHTYWLLWFLTCEGEEGERTMRIPGIGTESTGSKSAEDYLRILETAMSTAKSGIVITDLAGRIVYVNRALLEMGGYTDPGELIGTQGLQVLVRW